MIWHKRNYKCILLGGYITINIRTTIKSNNEVVGMMASIKYAKAKWAIWKIYKLHYSDRMYEKVVQPSTDFIRQKLMEDIEKPKVSGNPKRVVRKIVAAINATPSYHFTLRPDRSFERYSRYGILLEKIDGIADGYIEQANKTDIEKDKIVAIKRLLAMVKKVFETKPIERCLDEWTTGPFERYSAGLAMKVMDINGIEQLAPKLARTFKKMGDVLYYDYYRWHNYYPGFNCLERENNGLGFMRDLFRSLAKGNDEPSRYYDDPWLNASKAYLEMAGFGPRAFFYDDQSEEQMAVHTLQRKEYLHKAIAYANKISDERAVNDLTYQMHHHFRDGYAEDERKKIIAENIQGLRTFVERLDKRDPYAKDLCKWVDESA